MDWDLILQKWVIAAGITIIGLVGGAVGWAFKTILKLKKDVDVAHHKIRHGADSMPKKNGVREYGRRKSD